VAAAKSVNGCAPGSVARFGGARATKNEGSKMAAKIMGGFPVRRCSWSYKPIVTLALTRTMIRWLDSVCLKRAPSRAAHDS